MLDVCRYFQISPREYEQTRPELRAAMVDYAVRDSKQRAAAERHAQRRRR
jgi:hypothetical protein